MHLNQMIISIPRENIKTGNPSLQPPLNQGNPIDIPEASYYEAIVTLLMNLFNQ